MKLLNKKYSVLFAVSVCLLACKSGPFNLLKSASPHQQYERKLVNSGLSQTTMGRLWINRSTAILQNALNISLPYQERGYFAADKVEAAAFRFTLQRGQKLQVKLNKKPLTGFMVYADVWEVKENGEFKLIAAADSLGNMLQSEVGKTGMYVLRLQPELLGRGSYTIEITAGASLAFPLKNADRKQIQSLFGVGRDENTRKHEGIDIFAAFRTPVIAVAAGTVTRVNENNLGGKVVWFRPQGKDYTLYYAHLDEQTVTDGQTVMYGDTLGRMGNTGNARTTPPHLHFGIYTSGGAIDPLPFVDPTIQVVPKIYTSAEVLNITMRTNAKATLVQSAIDQVDNLSINRGTILRVIAATGNNYKIELPDGQIGYINGKVLSSTITPLSKFKIHQDQLAVYDQPDSLAIVKLNLKQGETVSVLGNFNQYQLIANEAKEMGWIRK